VCRFDVDDIRLDSETTVFLTGLKWDGADFASQINYNSSSQTSSLKVGAAGANQITENYTYDIGWEPAKQGFKEIIRSAWEWSNRFVL
jgi:hypothetical protein